MEMPLGRRTWQATQLDLGRRVALRRLDPGTAFHASDWPEHPDVVPLYAVVETDAGTYVATRLVPGARTLAESRGARPAKRRRWLAVARAVLDEHPHGDLTEHDILIDPAGRVSLTGFGRGGSGDDAAALARMSPPESRRSLAVPAAVLAVALAGRPPSHSPGTASRPCRASSPARRASAAPSPAGTGAASTATAAPPTAAHLCAPSCRRGCPAATLAVPADGIVRRWTVRGARGRIALVVLRPVPGGFVRYNQTRTVTVTDADAPATFAADRSAPTRCALRRRAVPGRRGRHPRAASTARRRRGSTGPCAAAPSARRCASAAPARSCCCASTSSRASSTPAGQVGLTT